MVKVELWRCIKMTRNTENNKGVAARNCSLMFTMDICLSD